MTEYGVGLHRDVPFADYAAIPAINSGVVTKWGDVSPLHVHEALCGRLEADDTKDKKFGRAVHCRLLEPERYAAEVLVATTCVAQKKNGAMCTNSGIYFDGKHWYCGVHRGDDCTQPADYVSAEEVERIEAMAARLHGHPALGLFKRNGWSELTGVYERNGVMCKFRSDRVPEEMDIIIDIKKTQVGKARIEDCKAAIANYGFHIQAAMNVDGIRAFHPVGREPRFVWVFIEDAHPYGVQVIVADDETIDLGRFELDSVLDDYRRARDLGRFPDYMPDGTRPFVGGLPDWKRVQIQKRKAAMSV